MKPSSSIGTSVQFAEDLNCTDETDNSSVILANNATGFYNRTFGV